jgi:anti-sigma factor RsiW
VKVGERERGSQGKLSSFFLLLVLSNSVSCLCPPRSASPVLERGKRRRRRGMGRDERFPVWEAALGAGVAAAFAAGLVGVYLSMPDSDYSFLKLPRNLQELQILTYVFF